jgi:hypothetical protein
LLQLVLVNGRAAHLRIAKGGQFQVGPGQVGIVQASGGQIGKSLSQ